MAGSRMTRAQRQAVHARIRGRVLNGDQPANGDTPPPRTDPDTAPPAQAPQRGLPPSLCVLCRSPLPEDHHGYTCARNGLTCAVAGDGVTFSAWAAARPPARPAPTPARALALVCVAAGGEPTAWHDAPTAADTGRVQRLPERRGGLLAWAFGNRSPTALRGNLPQLPEKDAKLLFGDKTPPAVLMREAPPVVGATAISGPMGSGKSLLLARMARVWQARGAELWTAGCEIAGADAHYGIDLVEMAEAVEARAEAIPWAERPWLVLALDEMAVMADSRDWTAFPKSLAAQITQIRKFRLIPYYTAVYWERVDALVRDFTGWVWSCRMTDRGLFSRGGLIVAQCWPPDSERREDERPTRTIRMRPRDGDLDAYDTGNVVKVESASTERDRARQAKRRADIQRQLERGE